MPCPKPTFLSSATEPEIQKACKPIPIFSAASAAVFEPFLTAIAAPQVYAQQAFSKAIGWISFTILYGLKPFSSHILRASSQLDMPYSFKAALTLSIRLS